jgi:hypothetical protein
MATHLVMEEKRTRTSMTPGPWLPVGAALGKLVNEWARRDDLIVYLGPGAGGKAPACYVPATAEIEINMAQAFGPTVTPEDLRLHTRRGRYEFPQGMGVTKHEAFHARWTRWDIKQASLDLAADEFEWLMALEESRIEGLGVRYMPSSKVFLRASAMGIIIESFTPEPAEDEEDQEIIPTAHMMANIVALVDARVELDILLEEDVKNLIQMPLEYFGEDVLEQLRAIYLEVHEYEDHVHGEGMYEHAREWARIVREAAEEHGEDENSGASEEMMQALAEALTDALESTMISSSRALADQEDAEKSEEIARELANRAKELTKAVEAASELFSKSSGPSSGRTRSRLVETRPPTSEERIAANVIAKQLERAKYHDREVREVLGVIPPGRLNTRALIQGVARREHGHLEPVEAWRRKKRKHVDDPQLTVGVMPDISGSMSPAMAPMASVAWIMSEAVRRVQGRMAMVYYGDSVFHTLRPGEHLTEVKMYSAQDGSEAFDAAFIAMDGALNLLHGEGARLLFIVSDGCYSGRNIERSQYWVQRCADAGVGVVMLPFSSWHEGNEMVGKNGIVIEGAMSPTEAAHLIGSTCAAALEKVS